MFWTNDQPGHRHTANRRISRGLGCVRHRRFVDVPARVMSGQAGYPFMCVTPIPFHGSASSKANRITPMRRCAALAGGMLHGLEYWSVLGCRCLQFA